MPEKWSKVDRFRLATYVNREVKSKVALNINILDFLQKPDGIREIVKTIYNTLLERQIRYAIEPSTSSPTVQYIRTYSEILGPGNEGTCLDLALLFCGMCLGCELIPILIVLDGHALVCVSLNFNLHQLSRRGRDELNLFYNILVDQDKADQIKDLIISGSYLAVECTGFAQSKLLQPPYPEGVGRQQDGTLSFDRAIAAGTEHFEGLTKRPFQYALDIATAQYFHDIDPIKDSVKDFASPSLVSSRANLKLSDPLPYLLDRSEQEKELRNAILGHRISSPLRPLLCIVHGDEFECHAGFLDRLEKISLPKILGFWYPEEVKQIPPLRIRMQLSLKSITDKNWEEIFWEDLATAITDDLRTPRDDVFNLISSRKVAILIDAPLLSEKMDGISIAHLNYFFEFWNRWQNLPEKLLLTICLSFKYQRRYEVKRQWYHFKKRKGLNDKLREFVRDLTFEKYKNLSGICLPELQAIPQTDAEAAVSHDLVRQRYGFTDLDVISIYQRSDLCTSDGRIPMYTLLEQFTERSRNHYL
jgi:hypothetical protein